MIAARNDKTICDVRQRVAISDKHFEVVKEFVYLGSLMTPSNDLSLTSNDFEYNEESRLQIGASSDCATILSQTVMLSI
jgi:hypothetical protein